MKNTSLPENSPYLHPFLGFGLGLRSEHYQAILDTNPSVDWFEILTENYLVPGGKPLYYLDQIAERYPIVMHGVSMSLGAQESLDFEYLTQVKHLMKRCHALWLSDHLCWTGNETANMHDLLPMPYTEEAVKHIAEKIQQAQDFLGCPLLIENVSSYLSYKDSTMEEWSFLKAVAEEANCLLLLDINNVYVSGFNHHFDPIKYLDNLPKERIQQFHLAGHLNLGDHIIDTHDHPIIDEVWALYSEALKRFGPISTMIERDANIPPLEKLTEELDKAKDLATQVFSTQQLEIKHEHVKTATA